MLPSIECSMQAKHASPEDIFIHSSRTGKLNSPEKEKTHSFEVKLRWHSLFALKKQATLASFCNNVINIPVAPFSIARPEIKWSGIEELARHDEMVQV